MKFDPEMDSWAPAHDREVRLRSSVGLIIGLVLMAVSAGALLFVPSARDANPRHTVAAVIP
jgi:hypothetical protein